MSSIQTSWNFKLFYKSEKDPQIEKDIKQIEEVCEQFAQKYQNNDNYLEDPAILLQALKKWEEMEITAGNKPLMYFHYIKDINSSNSYAEAQMNKIISRFTKSHNKILFFTLKLGKISVAKQKEFLNDVTLSHYHYFLKRLFETAKYNLSENEEKILNLKAQPSRFMWIDGVDKLTSKQTVTYQKKQIPLPEAFGSIPSLGTKERRKLHDQVMMKLQSISDFAEAEINAVYTDKKINDELRGLENPYDATIIGYHNDPKAIITLVNTITKHFKISHSFYKIKAKLLKEKKLEYADRSASVGRIKATFDFKKSKELVLSAFGKIHPKYADMFTSFLEKGQIDVYPKKGKTGGAYCSSATTTPTMVLLNHTSDIRAVSTLAHEMGHAFHSELSKSQSPLYQEYTISVAEVASTLFENFVFDEMVEKLSDKEKIIALHNQINDDVSTIFRQIACFNFERELHNEIRTKGTVPKEDIAKLMNKHMKSYLGPIMNLKESDGYFFVNWGHIRNFFYVYSYAYGQLISKALYAKYKEDPSFLTKIEQFLSAGGSKSPEQIFKDIGIDTSKPEFFIAGLKTIEADIKRLEKLAKQAKMI